MNSIYDRRDMYVEDHDSLVHINHKPTIGYNSDLVEYRTKKVRSIDPKKLKLMRNLLTPRGFEQWVKKNTNIGKKLRTTITRL